ncbi:Holliday junction branch migration protein RuvA [soil metagenome]
MIGRLRGQIIEIEGMTAVVDVAGVGYEVSMQDAVIASLSLDQSVDLYIRQIFREDGVSLYGFSERVQRRLFDLLLTVKACGPKVVLALLGQVGEETIVSSILAQDSRPLIRATGVGAKLAERITLELREKIQEEALIRRADGSTKVSPKATPDDELVDALLALGYRRSEVESVANDARQSSGDVQEQLRYALRMLKK